MLSRHLWIWVVALAALGQMSPAAQSAPQQKPSTNSAAPAATATHSKEKPALDDITRVSTDQAVQSAARSASKKQSAENRTGEPAQSEVLEFRPAATDQDSPKHTTTTTPESRKSKVKNVHGTVYGSLDAADAANRSTGASAGVSSKSGKSHIYVETERSRATTRK
jgi:hypothetical protein